MPHSELELTSERECAATNVNPLFKLFYDLYTFVKGVMFY